MKNDIRIFSESMTKKKKYRNTTSLQSACVTRAFWIMDNNDDDHSDCNRAFARKSEVLRKEKVGILQCMRCQRRWAFLSVHTFGEQAKRVERSICTSHESSPDTCTVLFIINAFNSTFFFDIRTRIWVKIWTITKYGAWKTIATCDNVVLWTRFYPWSYETRPHRYCRSPHR